ncbi:hypothetical protein IDH41_14180 [Paenibacillus sp. IB182493]|uniref:Uncharacterized protein n=1 Tax=Paenibacillus arenilitoris TaxID=2772299 RepID=A0A927H6M6_9BACL|nr:hypothetical protein [Paenibacillus arenilitoris]
MKKISIVLLTSLPIILGFAKKGDLVLTSVETTIRPNEKLASMMIME